MVVAEKLTKEKGVLKGNNYEVITISVYYFQMKSQKRLSDSTMYFVTLYIVA